LITTVKENLSSDYDGIIVTHGTDTLGYSAAALAYALGNGTVPVCLVSSNSCS
jgi:L-asparaginase